MHIEVRVAGILVEEGKLLLVEHDEGAQGRYWVLPGGRVCAGESLAQALRREWKEELRLDVETGALVFVNDFISPHRHVIDLYFDVRCKAARESLKLAPGPILRRARFYTADELTEICFRPDIVPELVRYLREGVVRQTYLGCR